MTGWRLSNVAKRRGAMLVGCGTATILAAASAAQPVGTIAPLAASPAAGAPDKVVAIGGDLSPLYGRIRSFYGDVDPSYGRIRSFYGRIRSFYDPANPFWSDPAGFWGAANPFSQSTDPATKAFYATSKQDAFWGAANPYLDKSLNYAAQGTFWRSTFAAWSPIFARWNAAQSDADTADIAAALQASLVAPTVRFWAPLVDRGKATTTATTDIVNRRLGELGITFNADGSINAASLLNSSPSDRAMLFLNLYDDLMDYSGTPHVDWWMGAVGWSPALAQIQGGKATGNIVTNLTTAPRPLIGMIDFVLADGKNVSKQVTQYGSSNFSDGHGAAVGSLIIGATDGSNVMGVMPLNTASVIVYNPYDDSGTADWPDVGQGVKTLANLIVKGRTAPMGVLNASLGVPGWTLHPGWNDALQGAGAHGLDLVIAAGNDGSTQSQDVAWDFTNNPTLIVVGSVGPDGTISNFSNRPGEACLLRGGGSVCGSETDKLKYRFIVAPGELILVSDGRGGHMRQSGTSLAAPLVSGAIALLQNRWPWLANYPDETAGIILKSATPRGDQPGADPVYGVGELNIAASQAPLNWGNLTYYQANALIRTPLKLSQVVAQVRSGTQSAWDASGLAFTALETIGSTYRDFQIPLSSKLVGQNVSTNAGGQAYQSFLSSALRAQAGRFAGLGAPAAPLGGLLAGFAQSTAPAGHVGGATLRVSVAPADISNAFQMRTQRYDTDAVIVTGAHAIQFGFGNGATALGNEAGFALRSDYDLARGGANPLLGLASGGAYFGARTAVLPGLTVGFGTTDRSQRRNLATFQLDRAVAGSWVNRYAARAQTVNVAYTLGGRLTARVGLTHLDERSALLGIQSLDRADLAGGSATDGVSLGLDVAVTRTLTLSGTGTLARTRARRGQLEARGLTSAAAQLGLVKARLFARADELRLSVASPLHAVGGTIAYRSYGVVDRLTGELGVTTQRFRPRQAMPVAAQAIYGMALPGGLGEVSLFGRYDRSSQLVTATDPAGYTGGAQFRLAL